MSVVISDTSPLRALAHLGTDHGDLYLQGRKFTPADPAEVRGYLVPVPPGRYRFCLHFAETEINVPGVRVFEVRLQGRAVLEDFDIRREVPFRTALEKAFEVTVERGPLEIRFADGFRFEGPTIAAIEIERLE